SVDVERPDVVVRESDFGRLIGGDPLAVVAGNGGAQDVLAPGLPAVLAGAHRNIREAETRHVEVVDAARVCLRGDAEGGVPAPVCEAPGRLGDLFWRRQRRVMQPAVSGLPRERAGGQAELRGDI